MIPVRDGRRGQAEKTMVATEKSADDADDIDDPITKIMTIKTMVDDAMMVLIPPLVD